MPEITLAEVNALAKNWVPDANRVVVVSAPQKDSVKIPDEKALAAVMASAAGKNLTAYVDTVDSKPLLDGVPAPGAVTGTVTKDAYGITEWQLANGVKVVLKPTTFKEDEIVFRAFSPGGTSLVADKDFIPASTASQVIASGGVGKFSEIDLRKMLTGKVASVRPFIGELEEGLAGSASRKDLETMFQLIYLEFTQPRADPTIFGVMTTQTKAALANQKATPEFAFAETLQSTLTQNHPRGRMMTPEMVDEMSLDKSLAFYKERFSDASDFTFVFVGSFDLATMKPLVERYLGALPSTHRKETWKDIGMKRPRGVIEKRVDKGIEPKSRARIAFGGPFQYDQERRVAIRAMADVLQVRLRESLREDLGGTYSVSASAGYSKFPREEYTLSIDFGSSPDRTEELVKSVFKEIDLLKTKGPTDKQVADVKETLLRDLETNSKQNGFLLLNIYSRYQQSEDLGTLFGLADYYNKLTAATIQEAAKTYLDTNNYVKVTLFPETKPSQELPRGTAGRRTLTAAGATAFAHLRQGYGGQASSRVLGQRAPALRMFDEGREPFEPRLLLLRADDPPVGRLLIGGRLRLEKLPGRLVAFERAGVRLHERVTALLVGVDARSVFLPPLEGLEASRPHPSLFGERLDALDVDRAPDASRPARREPYRVTDVVHAPPDAVDPADRERFVHGLGPGDARLARVLLVEAHQQLPGRRVVLVEPFPQVCRRTEERRFHSLRYVELLWQPEAGTACRRTSRGIRGRSPR